jgi:hypothetical protein
VRHFTRILTGVILAAMLGLFSKADAQVPTYYGPLLYSMPLDTSVPPLYVGQPPTVTEAYLWLDDAMRLYPEYTIESYFNSLSWGDTLKTLASTFYQVQDDNPLSFFFWSGSAMHPNPYKGNPAHGIVAFQQHLAQIVGDTGRTASMLTADIIADVMVGDTFCVIDPTIPGTFYMAFVNSTILDEIKGKKIPYCVGEGMSTRKQGKTNILSISATTPWATYAVPADTGTCLQFEYSPYWLQTAFFGQDGGPKLVDSIGGWWIKPGHEYIVFLNLMGIGANSTTGYFTLRPGPAALGNGGMYPVVDGIVQDPNDDYGIGASAGLPVAVWKARFRAKISTIVTP